MKNLCALALVILAEAWFFLFHKGAFATATAIIALAIAYFFFGGKGNIALA